MITEFLSSPIWGGIQGLLAILAIIIAFGNPRKWLEERQLTKWITKVPWIWLFILAGIAAGIGASIKFQDIYRGMSVTFASVALGLGFQLIQVFRFSTKSEKSLEGITSKYKRLTTGLKRVVHLLPSEFKVADWKMIHTIDDDGSDSMREELTIIPSNEPVYFYFKKYVVAWDAGDKAINVFAKNILDNTPLSIFEVERIGGYVYFVILLDPPSTTTSPKRIEITCVRERIWSSLIKDSETEGAFNANHSSDLIHVEILAPRNRKWKGFHPAPVLGKVELESSGSISRVLWTLKNPQPRKYTYQVYLESNVE